MNTKLDLLCLLEDVSVIKKCIVLYFMMMRIMLTFGVIIAYFNVFSDAMILCIGLFS